MGGTENFSSWYTLNDGILTSRPTPPNPCLTSISRQEWQPTRTCLTSALSGPSRQNDPAGHSTQFARDFAPRVLPNVPDGQGDVSYLLAPCWATRVNGRSSNKA